MLHELPSRLRFSSRTSTIYRRTIRVTLRWALRRQPERPLTRGSAARWIICPSRSIHVRSSAPRVPSRRSQTHRTDHLGFAFPLPPRSVRPGCASPFLLRHCRRSPRVRLLRPRGYEAWSGSAASLASSSRRRLSCDHGQNAIHAIETIEAPMIIETISMQFTLRTRGAREHPPRNGSDQGAAAAPNPTDARPSYASAGARVSYQRFAPRLDTP